MASNTMEVGKKLVDLIRQKKFMEAVDTLYSPKIVSIEAQSMPSFPQRMEGIDAIKGKNKMWIEGHETHSAEVEGPFPHGDRFIIYMNYDATAKVGPTKGKRMKFKEAALYTVKDEKIVQEEFFYLMEM